MKQPKCATCKKPFGERYMQVNCDSCNEYILKRKIENRETELQWVYDTACDEEKRFELEIEATNLKLAQLKAELKEWRKTIDKCILREQEYGVNVL